MEKMEKSVNSVIRVNRKGLIVLYILTVSIYVGTIILNTSLCPFSYALSHVLIVLFVLINKKRLFKRFRATKPKGHRCPFDVLLMSF